VPADRVAATKQAVGQKIAGLDEVDQPQLDKSLTIFHALEGLAKDERFSAMAVRCWPEMFTITAARPAAPWAS
jgi:hypothetical protein